MAKEILLYGDIYSHSMERLIEAINTLEEERAEEIVVRINSEGGDPLDMTGVISKLQSFNGNIKIKIDGKAYSSGAFFLLYTDKENIEATDVSRVMFHRGGFSSYVENNPELISEEMAAYRDGINANLKAALESRVDSKLFKDVTGVSIKDMFSNDSRIDVHLNAKQLKKLGLVGKINTITPKKQSKMTASYLEVAAKHDGVCVVDAVVEDVDDNKDELIQTQKQKKKMTRQELQASHPALLNEVLAEGAKAERDRVGAWLAFNSVDAKRVQEGIKSGEAITQTDMAELTLEVVSKKEVEDVSEESPQGVKPKKVEAKKSDRNQELEDFSSDLRKFRA